METPLLRWISTPRQVSAELLCPVVPRWYLRGWSSGTMTRRATWGREAAEHIHPDTAPALEQEKVDKLMIETDGTEYESGFGANAILGVSLALRRHLHCRPGGGALHWADQGCAPGPSERLVKCNQVLRIQVELGSKARFAGRDLRNPLAKQALGRLAKPAVTSRLVRPLLLPSAPAAQGPQRSLQGLLPLPSLWWSHCFPELPQSQA